MPQFDTFSFFSQISWTLFIFCLIFLINSYSLLPVAAVVLKTRTLQAWSQNILSKKNTNAGNSKGDVKINFKTLPRPEFDLDRLDCKFFL
jgi:hypothetical protein